jgi:hypothetical protein
VPATPTWQPSPAPSRATAPATDRPEPAAPGSAQTWSPAASPNASAPPVPWAPTPAAASGGTVPAPRPGTEGTSTGLGAGPFAGSVPAAATAAHEDDDEDDDDLRPRHPYTWLHFLALILVAFVLGFLIVLLWSRSGALSASGTGAAPASASAVHTSFGLVADPV